MTLEIPHKTHLQHRQRIHSSVNTTTHNPPPIYQLTLNMGISKLTSLAILALRTVSVFAAVQDSVSSSQAPASYKQL